MKDQNNLKQINFYQKLMNATQQILASLKK